MDCFLLTSRQETEVAADEDGNLDQLVVLAKICKDLMLSSVIGPVSRGLPAHLCSMMRSISTCFTVY